MNECYLMNKMFVQGTLKVFFAYTSWFFNDTIKPTDTGVRSLIKLKGL